MGAPQSPPRRPLFLPDAGHETGPKRRRGASRFADVVPPPQGLDRRGGSAGPAGSQSNWAGNPDEDAIEGFADALAGITKSVDIHQPDTIMDDRRFHNYSQHGERGNRPMLQDPEERDLLSSRPQLYNDRRACTWCSTTSLRNGDCNCNHPL